LEKNDNLSKILIYEANSRFGMERGERGTEAKKEKGKGDEPTVKERSFL
jgi:hypothetical protein